MNLNINEGLSENVKSAFLLRSHIVIKDKPPLICFVLFRHANEVLRNETTMFEKYLKRVDPKDIGLQATHGKKPLVNLSYKN